MAIESTEKGTIHVCGGGSYNQFVDLQERLLILEKMYKAAKRFDWGTKGELYGFSDQDARNMFKAMKQYDKMELLK